MLKYNTRLLICASALIFASAGAAVSSTLPSILNEDVTIYEVKQTPISDEDLCTLMRGHYCGTMPAMSTTDRLIYDPTPLAWM